MRGRGLLIFLATLVVLLSALSSLRTSSEKKATKQNAPATTTSVSPATKPAPSGISAVMPADPKVKLAPGQQLTLQVRSASPDVAAISELGLEVPVGPDVPGEIVLIAPSSGSFDVTLQVAQRKVGEIVVKD
jgi:hypothetical protein